MCNKTYAVLLNGVFKFILASLVIFIAILLM